jgi:undecaprenyl-diphosphatase
MLLMDKIVSLDYLLTNFLNKLIPHNIFFDYFFSFFSLKGASILVWILIIAMVVILEERRNPGISKKDKKFIILFSLSFLLTLLFTDVILKHIFQRIRPFLTLYGHVLIFQANCPKNFSFPSGHASTAFAAATILTFFDKKRRWFYYTVAVLISYSRIYLGCHYFLDVIAGAIIGYIISQLLLFVHDTFPFRRKS